MRTSIAMATFMALAAGTLGVGAKDSVKNPNMVGSDTLKELTLAVLNSCAALTGATPANPIVYDGTGSGAGENAMKSTTPTQFVAPMSRPMNSGLCTATAAARQNAEGLVVALDAVGVIVNATTAGAGGIDYPGNAGDTTNQWRAVLRLVYTGMDPATTTNNVFTRDCAGAARQSIVNNWDNVFKGTASACTDSNPGTLVEPGVRHAFRRDDESGTTDVFLGQMGLSGINFQQAAPANSTPLQVAAYRALAGSPFCNNKRPDDDWAPTTLPANTSSNYAASVIPEVGDVGALPTAAGTGLHLAQIQDPTNAKFLQPFFNEYVDQDPIRRKCVGSGFNIAPSGPIEQVCEADGTLGVVLPISIPQNITQAQAFPTIPCDPDLGFYPGPAPTRPDGVPVRCPNGDATQDGQCQLPVRSQPGLPNDVAFDCLNPPLNRPTEVVDSDRNGSEFADAPTTDGRPDADGRAYNLILRRPDGTIRTVNRPDASRVGVMSVPVIGAFYRIHSSRSLLATSATNACAVQGDTDQIGCLTVASPCSIGYAGRGAVTSNPGSALASVNGIANTVPNIKSLVLGGTVYPFARKLYVNSMIGFDALRNSDPTIANFDAEEELVKCFGTLPFNGTINVEDPKFGFVKLPPATGETAEKALCEDFIGSNALTASVQGCGDATNTDACATNPVGIPVSLCDNGLKDGAETGPDVCPTGQTCNTTTHKCQ